MKNILLRQTDCRSHSENLNSLCMSDPISINFMNCRWSLFNTLSMICLMVIDRHHWHPLNLFSLDIYHHQRVYFYIVYLDTSSCICLILFCSITHIQFGYSMVSLLNNPMRQHIYYFILSYHMYMLDIYRCLGNRDSWEYFWLRVDNHYHRSEGNKLDISHPFPLHNSLSHIDLSYNWERILTDNINSYLSSQH